nr:MATE family efflux transporter [Maliibacterium massiliense]
MKTALRGDRSFYSGVLRIGLPVALQNLLISSASIIDTLMISSQGENAVAAMGMCAQFALLMFSAYFGFCHGGVIFIAQYRGARNKEGICRTYGLMFSTMMFFGLLFGAMAIFAPQVVMQLYTDKTAIQQIGVAYLRIVGFSYPLQVLAYAMSALLRATERVRIPLYASIASLLTNALLNWVLIYGRFGLPAMGVRGAAIATLAAGAVNVSLILLACLQSRNPYLFRVREHFRWTKAFLKQFFVKSAFIVGNEMAMGTGNMLLNAIIGRQPAPALAALAVFRVIESMVFSFFKGFTSAAAVMVGKQVGSGNHLQGYTDAKRFVLLCPAVTLLVCLLILPFRAGLLGLFHLSGQAQYYGMHILLMYTVFATLRSCNWISNDSFRAGGDSAFGTILEFICLYCFTLPALALGSALHLPFLAMFGLMFLDDAVRIGIVLWRVNSGRWIKPVTKQGRVALPAFHALLARGGRPAAEETSA